ncbi:prostate stem cell antigen-like [Neolamprologus brichardi]|uniref:prostate stem cell antigen-like n=1 Tax=Neolamprologus brichardi TaxID=32507 RepID=UPI0016438D41|nr:prostate stem cell antigen-like [Neolamprologus brichardi]
MQLYAALILSVTLSAVCGLRCYTCTAADPKSCTDTKACALPFDRCYSVKVAALTVVTKGCQTSGLCVKPMSCCEGDLCNSAIPTGPSAIVLLVSSAILKFLNCQNSATCVGSISCSEGDLCNSTISTGPSAILGLVSSAILKFLF